MEYEKERDDLLIRLRNCGDERDFRLLYDLLYDRFFRIAIYYLKKEEWSQEVVLDVFMTLWNKRKELTHVNNFQSYCFILLKNASLNYLEKHKQIHCSLEEETLDVSETPESKLLNDELLLVYVNALDELPPRCREIFILAKEQTLSYKEIAANLEISTKTVDAQLQKATKHIKEKINLYFS